MHELSIAQDVVETVLGRLDRRVTGVRLEVGPLSGVLPDSLRFCFDVACSGTSLEGAWLDIVETPARARCRACSAEFEPVTALPLCRCGSADVATLSGTELRITAVEVA